MTKEQTKQEKKPLKEWQRNIGKIELKKGEVVSYLTDDNEVIVSDTTNPKYAVWKVKRIEEKLQKRQEKLDARLERQKNRIERKANREIKRKADKEVRKKLKLEKIQRKIKEKTDELERKKIEIETLLKA